MIAVQPVPRQVNQVVVVLLVHRVHPVEDGLFPLTLLDEVGE